MQFKEMLRDRMNHYHYSAADVSKLTGISAPSVNSHLKGILPGWEKRKKYAEVLHFDLNDITYGDEKVNMSVIECSKAIGKGPAFVQRSILQGKAPFGFAVQFDDGHFEYSIPRQAVMDYMHQTDRMEMFMKFIDERLQERK